MKTIKYIGLSLLTLAFIACETDNEIDTGNNPLPALTAGSVDFSTYVAVGASFTAGVSDGGLFLASQENSFTNTLAKAFRNIGGGEFLQPLVNDNTGNINAGGVPVGRYRFVTVGGAPAPLDVFLSSQGFPVPPVTTEAGINIGSDFNNFGIPSAKSFDLTTPGYAGANPYYARIASAPAATVLQDALAKNPTFFTLSEVGGNDVLGFATSGGDGSNPITDQGTFGAALNTLVDGLTANGAKGAITNVPSIPSLPFFTTVPNNALALDAGSAASLTGFFQAVTGIFTQGLILQGVPPADAVALASQYALTFNEGPNLFLIDVTPSPSNPLGFRQMTENELLLLTIDQAALAGGYGSVVLTPEVLEVLGILQTGGTPTPEQAGLVIAAVSGIDDGDALDTTELAEIASAAQGYNSLISAIAEDRGLAFVDLKSILEDAADGIEFDAYTANTTFVFGGLVSLDGVHLTARGYALMANGFLEAIDATYNSNFKASGNLAKADDFPVFYSPTLQ
jgi:lysophospholipase L1-like esterase